jgi:hypothetical protein
LTQQQHLRHGEKISQLHHLGLDSLQLNTSSYFLD